MTSLHRFGASLALTIGAELATLGFAQAQSASATTSWIADHLPTFYFTTSKTATQRDDIRYEVSPCVIRVIADTSYHVILSGAGVDSHPARMTILRLHPSSGYRFPAEDKELKKGERLSSFRGEDDNGFRITYSLDLRHIDPAHIEIEEITTEPGNAETVTSSREGDSIQFPFYASHASLVPRLARAFRHGIEVCGGKADPF